MAFDMGFDFRTTAGYVTDAAEGVPVLAEAYPHTYTNGNGYSVNGGFTGASHYSQDRASGNDPRLAGINYNNSGETDTFTCDLSSGSAPGAGDYTVDLAAGDAAAAQQISLIVKDSTTALITIPKTSTTGAGYFFDATGTQVAATTTWTGTTVGKTWATTTVNIVLNPAAEAGVYTTLAHFRLTLQAAGAAAFPSRMLMLLGVGA